jgi:hypothetical protein
VTVLLCCIHDEWPDVCAGVSRDSTRSTRREQTPLAAEQVFLRECTWAVVVLRQLLRVVSVRRCVRAEGVESQRVLCSPLRQQRYPAPVLQRRRPSRMLSMPVLHLYATCVRVHRTRASASLNPPSGVVNLESSDPPLQLALSSTSPMHPLELFLITGCKDSSTLGIKVVDHVFAMR